MTLLLSRARGRASILAPFCSPEEPLAIYQLGIHVPRKQLTACAIRNGWDLPKQQLPAVSIALAFGTLVFVWSEVSLGSTCGHIWNRTSHVVMTDKSHGVGGIKASDRTALKMDERREGTRDVPLIRRMTSNPCCSWAALHTIKKSRIVG